MFPPRYYVFPHMLTWSYTCGYIWLFSFNWNLTETCKKVVRFRCDRSNGNTSKRHQTDSGNACWASCFRKVFTYFFHVSVYGFLIFLPVYIITIIIIIIITHTQPKIPPIALTKGLRSKRQLFYSLRWPIDVFNSVVNTKLPAILYHRRSTTVS